MTDRATSRSSVNAANKQYDSLPFIDDKLSEINVSMAEGRPATKRGPGADEAHAAYEKHQ